MDKRCATVRLSLGQLAAFARLGTCLSILALEILIWTPIAQAAHVGATPGSVHLPHRKALLPGHAPQANGAPQGYIPCDIIRAYHLDMLHAAGFTGAKQQIAIVAGLDDPNAEADLRAFDAAFGLPDPQFKVYKLGTPPSAIGTGWDTEINIDVEWAHVAAPGAAIALVEAPVAQIEPSRNDDLLAAVDYAVNQVGADVVSMSWGTGEFAGEATLDSHFPATNKAGKPVMYVAAVGDNGFGTSWPAASPAVLAVGGTSLAPGAVGNDTQQPHLDCSGMKTSPGVTPQDETVWGGQDCSPTLCTGTAGGIATDENRPAWQSGLGLPGNGRAMPDVAMLGDPFTGVALYSNGSWSPMMWGGTSLGAPLWTGVIALLNQQRQAAGLSNLNVTPAASWVYQLSTLNDIVTGSSPGRLSDPCISAATCVARPGFDLVTGRGSPVGTPVWEPLGGGSITSTPHVAYQGNGRLDVFARGPDAALLQRTRNGGQWGGWQSLGGVLRSAPAAVAWSPGRLDVFVRGTDNGLWHRWWDGRNWSGWESLGGVLTAGPAAASWSAGRLDLFVRGTDQALWHKWWDGTRWNGWEGQGGVLAADPSAVSWGPDRIDVFVEGTDSGLWHRWWDGRAWNGWEPFGGSMTGAPDAASPASSQLDVFALTSNGALEHKAYAGRWGAWLSLGGKWASDPGVVSERNGTVDVFEQGTDGQLWHTALPCPSL